MKNTCMYLHWKGQWGLQGGCWGWHIWRFPCCHFHLLTNMKKPFVVFCDLACCSIFIFIRWCCPVKFICRYNYRGTVTLNSEYTKCVDNRQHSRKNDGPAVTRRLEDFYYQRTSLHVKLLRRGGEGSGKGLNIIIELFCADYTTCTV